jgi:hypothetical protein
MAIEKLPMDEPSFLATTAQVEALAFEELKELPKERGLEILENFCTGTKKIFKDFDSRWIALCEGDVSELTSWANRMRSIQTRLDELDRQLAVKGTRLLNWDTVTCAMGYVNAHRVAIEQTLDHNERLAKA